MYEPGKDPDYRFSFANERTLLAWLRTALALLAAGVAIDAFDLSLPHMAQTGVASLLLLLGMSAAAAAWVRWARAERAIRLGEPLPASWLSVIVSLGVALTATVLLVVEMFA